MFHNALMPIENTNAHVINMPDEKNSMYWYNLQIYITFSASSLDWNVTTALLLSSSSKSIFSTMQNFCKKKYTHFNMWYAYCCQHIQMQMQCMSFFFHNVHTEKCWLRSSRSSQSNPVTSSCFGRLSSFLLPGLGMLVGFPLPLSPAATQVLAPLGLGAALPRPLPLPSNPMAAAYNPR